VEKMFIEALAGLKGGKKKLREMLGQVVEEYDQAKAMRQVWTEKCVEARETKELIEGILSPNGAAPDHEPIPDSPKDSLGE
jgi:hypothetical protein